MLAPAKINLSLRVGPPQADGRHPLHSLVAFTKNIGDHLHCELATGLSLRAIGPFAVALDQDDDNLVMRAAKLLGHHAGQKMGAKIQLTKNLPIASGIGGGSADAAATLIGLNELWDTGFNKQDLAQLGGELGADVPACVLGQACMMTGTGEDIIPLPPLPNMGIVLLNPLKPCPTGPVYQQYDRMDPIMPLDPNLILTPSFADQSALLAYLHDHPNDLEPAARALVPEIELCLNALRQSPEVLVARMSGSGGTCFGLYRDAPSAHAAAVSVQNKLAPMPVWVEADVIG